MNRGTAEEKCIMSFLSADVFYRSLNGTRLKKGKKIKTGEKAKKIKPPRQGSGRDTIFINLDFNFSLPL